MNRKQRRMHTALARGLRVIDGGAESFVPTPAPAAGQGDLDKEIVHAAVGLHRLLLGAEIDAPGAVGDALRLLSMTCTRAGY